MIKIEFRAPQVPAGLGANLLGLAGLIAVAVCIGGFLASLNVPGCWWIAGLIGAVEAIWLSVAATSRAEAEQAWAKEPTRKLKTVPAAAKSA